MKFLFDLFPVILFFIAFKFGGIYVATGVAIAATFAQIGWTWVKHRKVDTMLWVSLGIITVFGGMTLVFHDETFIKWKPTVLYWSFAAGARRQPSVAREKNLIRTLLAEQIELPEPSHGCDSTGHGSVSLSAWASPTSPSLSSSTFRPTTWVNFKLFGGIGLMLLFALAQGLLLSKYITEEKK